MTQHGGRRPAKYRQIAADLRARIERGEWAVGEQMPILDELSAQYGVVTGTVDKALGVLRQEGIAETIHGTGTFVREPVPSDSDLAAKVDQLSEQYRQLAKRVGELEAERHARQ